MTPPGGDEKRLRELEKVTAAYGNYARLGKGLSLLPASLCLVGAAWASWTPAHAGALLLAALAPPVAVVGAVAGRRWYQRHGHVVSRVETWESYPSGPEYSGRMGRLALGGWFFLAGIGFALALYLGGFGAPSAVPALGFASALLTVILLWRSHPRRDDGFPALVAVIGFQVQFVSAPEVSVWWRWPGLAPFGLGMAASGIAGHLHYLRLENRLAALKSAT